MSDKRVSADYQRAVSDFVYRNVVCCVSSLVSDVRILVANADRGTLRATSFDEDDLNNLVESKDYETPAREHIVGMDRDDLISALEFACVKDDRPSNEIGVAAMELLTKQIESGDFDPAVDGSIEEGGFALMDQWPGLSDDDLREKLEAYLEEDGGWEDFCTEHSLDPEYHDVYEHWAVDPWFGARLKDRGEVVEDFGNLTVWGRCTTGQAISMDWVVCQIYDEVHAHHQEQSA